MKQRFDRVHLTPNEKGITTIKVPEVYGTWTLSHIGCYIGKYGKTSYIDIYNDPANIRRLYFPKFKFEENEKLSRNDKFMTKVHDGKIKCSIRRYRSLTGYDKFICDFIERK